MGSGALFPGAISVLIALSCAIPAAGASWGLYRRDLRPAGPVGEYGVFTLDKSVHAHARGDLADLRVIDGEGAAVPMAVIPASSVPSERRWGVIFNQVFRGDEGGLRSSRAPASGILFLVKSKIHKTNP